jgi:hypothetical protein
LIGNGSGRFRNHAAELFTIFAGILLALFADAAWDYSSDRRRESEYLNGLRDELVMSTRELEHDEHVRAAGLETLTRAITAARGDRTLDADSAPATIVALLNYRFFSPARAVLDDLIDSGSLRIIRSDSLRFQLQRYRKQLEQLAVVEQRERDFIAETLEPYVAARVRLDDLLELQSYDDPVEQPPTNAAAFAAMLVDDEFASLAFMRWERSRTASAFGNSVAFTIRRLIDVLDAELGESAAR